MLGLAALRARLADDPGAVIETVAREAGVTPREALEALPEAMRQFAGGEFFVKVMEDIARWGEVTTIVHTEDGIFEFTGPMPSGKEGRGYYNLGARSGLHGHLRPERCHGIAFVERPFMGRPSAFVAFLNPEGGIMFKVFVGRTGKGDLRPEQLNAFRALAETVVPVTA